jgi:hypothetical protein
MGESWDEMVQHHPKFTTYIDGLPDNFNNGEPLLCAEILREVFEDLRKWAQRDSDAIGEIE